jgi:hypothetical protein
MGHSALFECLTWSASIQLNERRMLSLVVVGGAMKTRAALSMRADGGFVWSCNKVIQHLKLVFTFP